MMSRLVGLIVIGGGEGMTRPEDLIPHITLLQSTTRSFLHFLYELQLLEFYLA